MLHVAQVRKRAAHVPREQRPAQRPQDRQEAVDPDVEERSQADAAVQDYRDGERGDGEEGCCSELHMVSVSIAASFRHDRLTYPDKCPRNRILVVPQMPHEVAHDPAHDHARQQLAEPNEVEWDERVVCGSHLGPVSIASEHLVAKQRSITRLV